MRWSSLAACGLLFAGAALAQDAPLPEPDPRAFVGPRIPTPEPAPGELEAVTGTEGADAAEPDIAEDGPAQAEAPPEEERPAIDVRVTPAEACHARLADLDADFSVGEPVRDGQCSIAMPVTLEAVGDVAIQPPALLDCETAEMAARWITETVVPQAEATLNAMPEAIGQASAYVCRNRTSDGSRLSEHGLGRALDVARVTFEDREAVVVSPETVEEPFLAALRRSGCNYFTTVLGPGSDADHDDHLHLDLSVRRSGYRLCQ